MATDHVESFTVEVVLQQHRTPKPDSCISSGCVVRPRQLAPWILLPRMLRSPQRRVDINRHLLVGAPLSDVCVVQILVDPVTVEVLDRLLDRPVVSEEVILHVFRPRLAGDLRALLGGLFHLASPDGGDDS